MNRSIYILDGPFNSGNEA